MIIFLHTLMVSLMTLSSFSTTAAAVVGSNKNLDFKTDAFKIRVTGNQNVPKFMFSSFDDTNTTYKIMFQKIYETDEAGNKIHQITLPSLDWSIGSDGPNVFWIRSGSFEEGRTPAVNEDPWSMLEFTNKFVDNTLKFDVILNGYKWSSDDATALNFAWKFSETTSEDEDLDESDPVLAPTDEEETEMCFGNGIMCFEIVDTATVTKENVATDIDVSLTFDDTDGVTVRYERFDGDLYHDPTFSFGADGGGFIGGIMALFATIFSVCL